jgi:hypothetical protein
MGRGAIARVGAFSKLGPIEALVAPGMEYHRADPAAWLGFVGGAPERAVRHPGDGLAHGALRPATYDP